VQAGYRNRYGHPAPEVVARYRALGIGLVDSVHCGAALWRSDAPGAVQCHRSSHQRYWHHVIVP
jgi:competence protein ComEC